MKNSCQFLFLVILFILPSEETVLARKRIPVMASHTIRAGYNTLENYKNIEEAGFTLAKEGYPSADIAMEHLKTASKTKVKLIINCPELNTDLETTARRFGAFDSFGGYDISDEPGIDAFSSLGARVNDIRAIDKDHLIWLNLLPIHASLELMQAKTYDEYVDKFIETVNPPFVSYDFYGVIKSGIHPEYYHNLELISRKCKAANLPFWAYVLASQFASYVEPTKGTMSFQAYNNLAYGAQGIEYFSYRRIIIPGLDITVSPIDTNYHIMPVYYDVKELNEEIEYYSRYFYGNDVKEVTHLSNSIPKGTSPTKELPYGIKVLAYDGPGFVVSHFYTGQNEYLLFVNKDYKGSQNLVLDAPVKLRRLSYYRRERKRGAGQLSFDIQPGSIALLKLK